VLADFTKDLTAVWGLQTHAGSFLLA